MSPGVSIRPAARGDAPALARLARAFHDFHGEPGGFDAETILRDGFEAPGWIDLILAERAGEIIGYAAFHNSYETGHAARGLYLSDLWVEPAARGCGAGRALIDAAAEIARARGAIFIWLVSQSWNVDAHAFYKRLGASDHPVHAHALVISGL